MKKIYYSLACGILFLTVACNNPSSTTTSADSARAQEDSARVQTDSTKFSADSSAVVGQLRVPSFQLLNQYSPDDLRYELLARSVFGTKADSLLSRRCRDTVKPTIRSKDFQRFSNDEMISAYMQKLSERKSVNVIYGLDNRIDVDSTSDPAFQTNSQKVVALIPTNKLTRMPNGNYQLSPLDNYRDVYHLCSNMNEKFLGQKVCAECSGFAISEQLVVSAGHCLESTTKPGDYYLVFDFRTRNMDDYIANGIPDSLVYSITEIVTTTEANADFSVARVNKPIPPNRIAAVSLTPHLNRDSHFYVMGFPCGLPMKVTRDASLRSDLNSDFFVIDSDTYGGNSGSPVFNSASNMVEGILVRGNKDFYIPTGSSCLASIICGQNDCRGEDATRMYALKKYIQ